ncbi:peptide chain release factor N(5)-glutamine methyltransferase [Plastoroseomonas arctica]|uniref:Release factor glutamine methyltransferase n=1 Tax=Plastoroseomonas arctica TaxID=1509237 RepID=A0AAF1K6Q7_9PROT|nr:peptide chain release factor N(5)-glutamine methyltransferase [Plastoroseomonas arctica]MBR0656766.1 peptide chain release factor N(5)-glutamine methyltransferase [Plastoroseomonas arctica]
MTADACVDPAGTVGFYLCRAGQHLRAASVATPRQEARMLLGAAIGVPPEELLRDARAAVAPEASARFAALLKRRLAGEPIAYLVGSRGFWTLDLAVSPASLIPRPDSETLVEAALLAIPDRTLPLRILDLGTGTGALLLAALSEYTNAWGLGVDRVPAAVELARQNAARTGLATRAAFLVGDWAGALDARFDLVLCNPPYIESAAIAGLMPEVARFEPASALDGGPDGLDAYRAVLAGLPSLLAPQGVAILELGLGQGPAVEALAAGFGLDVGPTRADLGGIARALPVKKQFGAATPAA